MYMSFSSPSLVVLCAHDAAAATTGAVIAAAAPLRCKQYLLPLMHIRHTHPCVINHLFPQRLEVHEPCTERIDRLDANLSQPI